MSRPTHDLTISERERILRVCANYHIRNGETQNDGSRGVIQITHKELNDELAKMFTHGVNKKS